MVESSLKECTLGEKKGGVAEGGKCPKTGQDTNGKQGGEALEKKRRRRRE